MQTQKTTNMQGNKEALKIANLQIKNKAYQEKNRYLSGKIRDITKSRVMWRNRFKAVEIETKALKKELNTVKKSIDLSVKAAHHSYPIAIIFIALSIRQVSGLGWRKCCDILALIYEILGVDLSVPCANTLSNWQSKYGLCELQKDVESGDKVLILDESVRVGQNKVLLLQGVDLAQYEFEQSLCSNDTIVLSINIQKSWKGEQIGQVIKDLSVKQDIVYAVCDGGNNLIKGLKDNNIDRVYDITHAIGAIVKNSYSKTEAFLSFSKEITKFKQKVVMGKNAIFMPPTQRPKARFLNISAVVKWADKTLSLLETAHLNEEQKQKLLWLKTHKHLITELKEVDKLTRSIFAILKPNGLSNETVKQCKEKIKDNKAPDDFKEKIKQYFVDHQPLIDKHNKLICCSDIIESTFGKFKNRVAHNKMSSMAGACLEICSYGVTLDAKTIRFAMEKNTNEQVTTWKDNNSGDNLLKNRTRLYKKVA